MAGLGSPFSVYPLVDSLGYASAHDARPADAGRTVLQLVQD